MIETPNWYHDIEIRIAVLEDRLANLNTQVQTLDSEIMLLQTDLSEKKEAEEEQQE